MQIILAWLGGALIEGIANIIQYSPAILVSLILWDLIRNKRK